LGLDPASGYLMISLNRPIPGQVRVQLFSLPKMPDNYRYL